MPLHADIKRMRWILETLDDAVRRERCDAKALTDVSNGLVMRGVYVEFLLADDLGEARALFHEDVVTMTIGRFARMLDVRAQLGIDVLNQRAARGDIHHLHTQTDAQRRHSTFARDTRESELVVLPARIHRLDAGVALFAVNARITIVATREQNPVEAVNDRLSILRLRRDDYRHPACGVQRFDECGVGKGSLPLPFFVEYVRADADDGLAYIAR